MAVIVSATVAEATRLSNQKKITELSTGRRVIVVNTNTNAKFYWTDNRTSFTDYGVDIAGWTNGSIHSYVVGGTEYIAAVWKQSGTGGGRTNNEIYVMVGSFDSGRTAITWGTAVTLTNGNSPTRCDHPDIITHAEGSDGALHVVCSLFAATFNYTVYSRVTATGTVLTRVALGSGQDGLTDMSGSDYWSLMGGHYTVNASNYPSIDIKSSTKQVFIAWTASAIAAGKGIRYRTGTYSAGSWTWNTERELDASRKVDAVTEFVICRYDSVNDLVMIGVFGDDGTNADIVLYQRDVADTTTTTYVLYNNASSSDRVSTGSMALDYQGNVYFFGRDDNTGTLFQYFKWTRTSATTGTVGALTTIENVGALFVPYACAMKVAGGSAIEFVYVGDATSTYDVDYDVLDFSVALTIAEASHGHTVDNLTLTQAHTLVVQEATHGHAADNLALTQAHSLIIADALHAHAVDNVITSGTVDLIVAEALHDHTVDNATLTQAHILVIAEALHSHTADNLALVQNLSLIIADALHAHGVDNLVITTSVVVGDNGTVQIRLLVSQVRLDTTSPTVELRSYMPRVRLDTEGDTQ